MGDRHLKRFDLPEPKTEAHFGLGRHIDLSRTMLEQTLLADSTVYGFTERAAVAFAKATDEMLLDAIVKKAKENGITDLYVLNEDFILEAIREKMERKNNPEAHGKWVDKPTGRYGQMQSWCTHCERHSGIGGTKKNRHKLYCPNCGAIMDLG